jgi:hypothetical protein
MILLTGDEALIYFLVVTGRTVSSSVFLKL